VEYLIVDGYNIINAWADLAREAKVNLEDARWKLLEILSDYQGYTKIHVIVVFDAHMAKGGIEKLERYGSIEVIFTKENETADNYIERFVHNVAQYNIVRVATSDYLEQTIILGKGALRLTANELLLEIERIKKENTSRKKVESNKRNTLDSIIDKNTLKTLERLRRKKF
jgi:predicted RNA-binding protein with PIN domain